MRENFRSDGSDRVILEVDEIELIAFKGRSSK